MDITEDSEQQPLQKNMFIKLEKRITQLDDIQPSMDPKNRRPFMSTMITCRDELRIAKKENLSVRKAALKKKIEEDYKAMESALIRMGLGFITTHP